MNRRAFVQLAGSILLCSSLPPRLRLITMGDSLTVGVGASDPDHGWPAIVARAYHRSLINVAVSSTRAAQQPAPAVQPGDLVIWLTGYNDMRAATPIDQFAATVADRVQQVQAAGASIILAAGLRMTAAGYAAAAPTWDHGSDAAAAAYAAAIAGLAAFVDLAAIAPTPVADSIHPNDSQYAAIAAAILYNRVQYLPLIPY